MSEYITGFPPMPLCYLITNDGFLIDVRGYNAGYIKNDDLKKLINSAKKTLAYNIKHSISDNFIDLANEKEIEKACAELSSTKIIRKPKVSDLYLIEDTILNTLKIGRSNKASKRFQQIQNATANKLKILFVIKDKGDIEFKLHEKFANLRLASEWFSFDNSIIECFENLNSSCLIG